MKALIVWGIIMNVLGFVSMGFDKARARKGRLRIPEKRLFVIAAAGGAAGILAGMKLYRHKTRHPAFAIGIPALAAANVLVYCCIARYLIRV